MSMTSEMKYSLLLFTHHLTALDDELKLAVNVVAGRLLGLIGWRHLQLEDVYIQSANISIASLFKISIKVIQPILYSCRTASRTGCLSC